MKFFLETNPTKEVSIPIQSIYYGTITVTENVSIIVRPNHKNNLVITSIRVSYDIPSDIFKWQHCELNENIYNELIKKFLSLNETPNYEDVKCYIVTNDQRKNMERQAQEQVKQSMLNYKKKQLNQETNNALIRERIQVGKEFVQHAVRNHKTKINSKRLQILKLTKELKKSKKNCEKEMFFARKVFEEMCPK